MIRTGTELLAALAEHEPIDERERDSLERLRALVADLPDPFDADADPTHVTSAGVVVDERGRLLLHRHRRLGIWLQPGGHVEPGESLQQAGQREVREETGLDTRPLSERPLHVDVHGGPRGHLHLDVRWLLLADAEQQIAPAPGESPVVRWFELAEAATVVDEGLAAVVSLLASRRPHQMATWSSVTPASSTSTGAPSGSGNDPRNTPMGWV